MAVGNVVVRLHSAPLLQCHVSLTGLIERRVKCPEQRPICSPCRRLGLACGYTLRLTWQEPSCVPQTQCTIRSRADQDEWHGSHVYDWMFLNVGLQDFDEVGSSEYDDLVDFSPAMVKNMQRTRDLFCQARGLPDPSLRPAGLSCINISEKEGRMWDYFVNFITPQCAVSLAANPYRSVVLRIAAATPGGPLFQCVMAIAACQMYTLGHGEPKTSSWEFRATALKSLRRHLDESQHGPEEAMVTIVMMSFLEVSSPEVFEDETTTNPEPDIRGLLAILDRTRRLR